MKAIALLFVTILLGAIGMNEVKVTYSQPDRDDNLLTKEIITGTMTQNIVNDSINGIPLFEKYNFPFDVRRVGDASVYETSDGDAYFETLEKMKERIYQPVFAKAGSENLVRLTYKPNIHNLRPASKHHISFIPSADGSSYSIDGIPMLGIYRPDNLKSRAYSYYWDGKVEGFAVVDFEEVDEVDRFHIYVVDKNAKIVKTQFVSKPDYACKSLHFTHTTSEYETNIYFVGSASDGNVDIIINPDGTITIPPNVGEIINQRGVIIKLDVASGTAKVVHEVPMTKNQRLDYFLTERYMVFLYEDRLVVFDKQNEKAHSIARGYNGTDVNVNPVLKSISIRAKDVDQWDIYKFNDDGITQIASKTADWEGNFKYLLQWHGNLDYDYLTSYEQSGINGARELASTRFKGRGRYQLGFGNVDYDSKFFYTKNYVRSEYRNYRSPSIERIGNLDDGDLQSSFGVGDSSDYYSPDRVNFLPFTSISQYIRLWRQEKAVFSVSMEESSTPTAFNIFIYD